MKKDTEWRLYLDGKCHLGTGPVELMQAACKETGEVLDKAKMGDMVMMMNGKWTKAACDFEGLRPVIPAPEPCQNCQNDDPWICKVCGRPESEWTYAHDIEWAGIGSGIM